MLGRTQHIRQVPFVCARIGDALTSLAIDQAAAAVALGASRVPARGRRLLGRLPDPGDADKAIEVFVTIVRKLEGCISSGQHAVRLEEQCLGGNLLQSAVVPGLELFHVADDLADACHSSAFSVVLGRFAGLGSVGRCRVVFGAMPHQPENRSSSSDDRSAPMSAGRDTAGQYAGSTDRDPGRRPV